MFAASSKLAIKNETIGILANTVGIFPTALHAFGKMACICTSEDEPFTGTPDSCTVESILHVEKPLAGGGEGMGGG